MSNRIIMKERTETDQAIVFIKFFLQKIVALKYVYITAIVLFVGLAFFYNKYSPKVYEMNSTIGPLKDTRTSALESNDMFRTGGYTASSSGKDLESAINSLSSFDLVAKTVNELNLEIGYFAGSRKLFKTYTEVYLQSPFIVTIDKSHIQTIGTRFYVTILSNSSYRLTAANKEALLYNYIDNDIVADKQTVDFDTICKFNETVKNKRFKFTIVTNPDFFSGASTGNDYYFELYHPEMLAKAYLKSLSVEPVSWIASIIKVKFASTNLQKSLNFLNTYVSSFIDENLAKKNKMALNTINYIDSQISGMSDSLVKSESSLKNYRSDNQVMDLSYQGQQIYSQISQIETQRANFETQSRYYNYVLNYFKTNSDVSGVTPPSSADINDATLNKMFSDLISTYSEKSSITSNTDKNLFAAQLESKIKVQKQAIVDNITNNLNTLNINLNELNYKSEKLSKDMSNLPKKEMNMVNVQRKFDLNNSIYTYLLQKKAESSITLSSNYPDYEVLEPAREITSEIVKPKILFNYLIAVFLALFFPTLYILITSFLNDKISSVYDLEHIVNKSVFGIIYANTRNLEAVVVESPGSAIAESFRNLRSSLFLKLKASDQSKVILLTSSQPQDGKSFISFNLSASIASVGFKTVLIDCDLRRPVLHDKFKIENEKGISNYMIKKVGADDIIKATFAENLYFIPAGPILTNPSELIGAGALDELISYLKTKFDYIIIDTPPLGLVADSIQLMKYASQILVVSRINSTKKEVLSNAIDLLESNDITNYEVILNDQNLDKSPYSSYKDYYHKD
jgi:tyrosine-protein kinase Etk/Wzc